MNIKIYFGNIILLSCVIAIFSCRNLQNNKPVIIDIQPFSDISKTDKEYVFNELKKIYSFIELKRPIELPQTAYYSERDRYRADSLINYLRRNTPDGHVTIGLTTKDISTTKNSISDWGVMGLGFNPGNACIASNFRLASYQKKMQLFKIAIHELGHTQGLPHCSVKSCFMRDAEGRNPTNEEKEFCQTCKAYLIDKGWQLK